MRTYEPIQRHSFGKIPQVIDYPDLLAIQTESFDKFLQAEVPPGKRKDGGLQAAFVNVFPIEDARGNYLLEFIEYSLDKPRYSVLECQENIYRKKSGMQLAEWQHWIWVFFIILPSMGFDWE